MQKRGAKPQPGPPRTEMQVEHRGEVLSFTAAPVNEGRALQLTFIDGTDQKERKIPIEGESPIELFCPSVEGTVILVYLQSGMEHVYDALTGQRLMKEDLEERASQIHFYT